jgi:hypothetical protein
MYLPKDYKLKYKHVALDIGHPSETMLHLNSMEATYLPCKVINFVHNA